MKPSGDGYDYRTRLLLAVLLRTRLIKMQARRILGRSYLYYKRTLNRLVREGLVTVERYSVMQIISLTEKGRRVAERVAGDIDPAPLFAELGIISEYWYTLPELSRMYGVSRPTLRKVLREGGLGLRPVGGVFAAEAGVTHRAWIIPESQIPVIEERLAELRGRKRK